MLKELIISNLILVDEARIPFQEGLNVISGESGSGKSAVMNALKLIQGAKSDPQLIRKGEAQGSIEAVFDLDDLSYAKVKPFLQESGIDFDRDEELLIRRVVFTHGKSRAFINNQLATAYVLRHLAPFLFEMVGQHASQSLMDEEEHRQLLDQYGQLDLLKEEFREAYLAEMQLKREIESLLSNEPKRLREMEMLSLQIEEIEGADLKEGEEDELFIEYKALANCEEIDQLASEFLLNFKGSDRSALALLKKQKATLKQLAELDPTHFEEAPKNFASALLELEDLAYHIERVQSSSHSDPLRLQIVNERLTFVSKLKKKYGSTLEEIAAFLRDSRLQLEELEHNEERIANLEQALSHQAKKTDQLAKVLSEAREKVAPLLGHEITQQLQELNMEGAKFFVQVQKQERTQQGDDAVEFFIAPNIGESIVSLKDAASGGEMARVLFALKAILSDKHPSTLVLDEIDANIGGKTAAVFGHKLETIGKKRQVICITHFPQVARKAQHHLAICKVEKGGRTKTIVTPLSAKARQQEIERMLGGVSE